MTLPRSLDDLAGLRAARLERESTKAQADNFGPASQRRQQDHVIERYRLVDTGLSWTIEHSGKTVHAHPKFLEMLAAARGGAFDVLQRGNARRPLDSRQSDRRYLSEQPVRTYGQSGFLHSSEPPRVIIVTGATSGIGRAAALALARRQWHVIASGRDAERGDMVAAEISAVGSGEFIAADLSKPDEPERLVAEVVERHLRLDGLVNDAGMHTLADTVETRPEDWDAILGVNLRAAFLLCRAAIPVMARSGGGVIVNVASEAALAAIPRQVAYNVSKAGMLMLTRSIAVDHATQGIRAVSVCPGTTMTPLVREAIRSAPNPEAYERSLAFSRPARRLGTVEEIATAIALVASPELEFMTGSELVIDGGFTAT